MRMYVSPSSIDISVPQGNFNVGGGGGDNDENENEDALLGTTLRLYV
tara:strand:- start:162 stop:302 length:141 start_codon:yes stop_codon:yes gene_type:complete